MGGRAKRVFVVGVGMTKFYKPGKCDMDYPELAGSAIRDALQDAGNLRYDHVDAAVAGYVYGESTSGQAALYTQGFTGIPVFNINNNCSTGSSALYLARQLLLSGAADAHGVTLAVGFEKMKRGSLGMMWEDRYNPVEPVFDVAFDAYDMTAAPMAPQAFGNAGREHMKLYGTTPKHFAKIAEKNHRHSVKNPRSQFRDEYTLEQIMESPMVHEPLTKLQCCPTSDGAAAAILMTGDAVKRYGLQSRAVELLAIATASDTARSFASRSCINAVGYDMAEKAAREVYNECGLTARDAQVVELHDCFSANELITYEALGMCERGGAARLIDAGDNTYGGRWVVNPSGGLISKGHPLGATGLAQCAELVWQLRGEASERQVPNAKVGLQHNIGLGGAAVVAMYRRPTDLGDISKL